MAIKATDNQRLGIRARLKATDARHINKPMKVDIRTKDKFVRSPDELLSGFKNKPRASQRALVVP